MGRVLVALLSLSFSLSAAAQTTAAPIPTDTIPARVNLDPAPAAVPAASTPIYVVAPPTPGDTNVVVPEYRVATPLIPSGPPPSVVNPAEGSIIPTSETANSSAGTGVVSYASAELAPVGPSISVAEAAARNRANKGTMRSRVIDQDTLSALDRNPSGLMTASQSSLPQGDLSPAEEAALRNAKPEYAAAGDVLDERDLAAVEAAVRRSEQQQYAAGTDPNVASTQYEQMTQEAEAGSRSAEPQADPAPRPNEGAPGRQMQTAPPQEQQAPQPDERDRLPESSSALPFVALLGFIAVAGGAASLIRAR